MTGNYSLKDPKSWKSGKEWGTVPDLGHEETQQLNTIHGSQQDLFAVKDFIDEGQNLKSVWETNDRMYLC